jgi:hypothetical protein
VFLKEGLLEAKAPNETEYTRVYAELNNKILECTQDD